MSSEKKSWGRRFLDWVNADENLPTLAELSDIHKVDGAEEEKQENLETQAEHRDEERELITENILESALLYPDELKSDEPVSERIHFWERFDVESVRSEEQKEEGILKFFSLFQFSAVLLSVAFIGLLLATVFAMPPFGAADNPTVNEVQARYVEKGIEETGATNAVAGMILDYRAFDTLGESFMLFTATTGVILLLRNPILKARETASSFGGAKRRANHEKRTSK